MTTGSYQPRGNNADRAARRAWLIATFRADRNVRIDVMEAVYKYPHMNREHPFRGMPLNMPGSMPACRCYRCGRLLCEAPGTPFHVTVDRIIPGCRGGTYRRSNIRPACLSCNSETGARLKKEI